MKILIDMNLSPEWVKVLENHGWQAIHWSTIGDPRATDSTLMDWARTNAYVIFTHDLDFGTVLATSRAGGPSVIQVRTQDVLPHSLGPRLVQILREYESTLEKGALLTVDEGRSRLRILSIE
jgi:predicted nuclease of predicted toxin-antitoxin system